MNKSDIHDISMLYICMNISVWCKYRTIHVITYCWLIVLVFTLLCFDFFLKLEYYCSRLCSLILVTWLMLIRISLWVLLSYITVLNKFSSNEEDAPEAYVKNVTHRKGCGKLWVIFHTTFTVARKRGYIHNLLNFSCLLWSYSFIASTICAEWPSW